MRNTRGETMRKWQGPALIIFLILVLVLIFGYSQRRLSPAPHVPKVSALAVQPQKLDLTAELSGYTAACRVSEIRPQVNGIIQKRLFTDGSDVKAGQVVYEINPVSFQAALENAKANLQKSEADLVTAQLKFEHYKTLLVENAISQWEYDSGEASLRQAKARALYCKAAVEIAGINLGHTHVTAPITGRIVKSNVTDGSLVTAYQKLPMATVQQVDPICVYAPQSNAQFLTLERRLELDRNGPPSQVRLLLEDGSEYPLKGMLQVGNITVDLSTGSVILRIVFANPQGVLLPGMPVRTVIEEDTNDQTILNLKSAVSRDPIGNPCASLQTGAQCEIDRSGWSRISAGRTIALENLERSNLVSDIGLLAPIIIVSFLFVTLVVIFGPSLLSSYENWKIKAGRKG